MGDTRRGCCPSMDLFRSEPMQLVQLIIPIESAHRTISYLGDLGLLQFKDLNAEKSPFQRTYAAQIKRCGEMARKLHFFKEQMLKAGLSSKSSALQVDINIDDLEVKLGELEAELVETNANSEKLQRSYNELVEYKLVLQKLVHVDQSPNPAIVEIKSDALSAWKSNLRDPNGVLQSWDSSLVNPCTWFHVTCVSAKVTQVDLGKCKSIWPVSSTSWSASEFTVFGAL